MISTSRTCIALLHLHGGTIARLALTANVYFIFLILLLSCLPAVSFANTSEQHVVVKKIVQSQTTPRAGFVADKKPNIIPILQLLLLDDEDSLCNESITLGQTVEVKFNPNCYNSSLLRYYKSYTFTIDQSNQVLISSTLSVNSANSNTSFFQLFSGSIATGAYLGNSRYLNGQHNMLNDLGSGTYTIRLLSNHPDTIVDLSLSEINCQSTPISIGTSTQVSFNSLCRSKRDAGYPFARYYTFTLSQKQAVSITASQSTGSYERSNVRLYAGIDVTAIPLDSEEFYYSYPAYLLNDLAAGTYTIEITSSDLDATLQISLSVNDCDTTPISVGSSVLVSFSADCRSIHGGYARYYTFTLSQKQAVSINTSSFANNTNYNYLKDIRLYSGSDITTTPLDIDSGRSTLLNELDPGTYTIVIINSLDALLELSLSENRCEVEPLLMGSSVDVSFNSNCRSLLENYNVIYDYNFHHPYARYYTFTLAQKQTVTISSSFLDSENINFVRLFSGSDVTTSALKSRSSFYYDENDNVRYRPVDFVNDLEPGTYTIELASANLEATLQLELSVNNCTATPIDVNSTTQGSFSPDCRSLSDSQYARYYTFTLDQKQTVSIKASSFTRSRINSYVRLYSGNDVSAAPLDSDDTYFDSYYYDFYDPAVLFNELDVGTYTIELTSFDLDATPQLGVHINNCQPTLITLNSTTQNGFDMDCRSARNYSHPYAHYYTFTLDQSQSVSIAASRSTSLEYSVFTVELYSGNDVSTKPINKIRTSSDQGVLTNELSVGTYTIVVTDYDQNTLVELSLFENNCEFSPVAINSVTQGSFSPICRSVRENAHRYARYYTFTLNQNQEISIATSLSTDSLARFYLYSGSDVTADPLDQGYPVNQRTLQLSAGSYTVEIVSSSVDAMLELSLFVRHCQVTPLNVGSSAQVSFASQCLDKRESQYARYYTFTLNQMQAISVTTTSPMTDMTDGYVRLYAGNNLKATPVDEKRIYYSTSDVLLNELDAGTYTIEITSSDPNVAMQVSLSVNYCPSAPLNIGSSVLASFTQDCRSVHYRHNYARYYTFTLDHKQTVLISASQLNGSYVRLYAGSDVTTNPIDWVKLNEDPSRLLKELVAGTYTIEIISFDLNLTATISLSVNNCQSIPLDLGTSVLVHFTADCRALRSNNRYAQYYSITLDQKQPVVITTSTASGGLHDSVRLYAGTDVGAAYLDSSYYDRSPAGLLNELDAGTYTIEINNSDQTVTPQLNVSVNHCHVQPLSVGSSTLVTLNQDCRVTSPNTRFFAGYYSFSLNNFETISIEATESTGALNYIALYSGNDVTTTDLGRVFGIDDPAVLLNELDSGTYTIQIASTDLDAAPQVNLSVNVCQTLPLSIDSSVLVTFNQDCRTKVDYQTHHARYLYAQYYTFTLVQNQTVSITTSSTTDIAGYVSLYFGSDVSGLNLSKENHENGQALLQRDLYPGTYTIELTTDNPDVMNNLSVIGN